MAMVAGHIVSPIPRACFANEAKVYADTDKILRGGTTKCTNRAYLIPGNRKSRGWGQLVTRPGGTLQEAALWSHSSKKNLRGSTLRA